VGEYSLDSIENNGLDCLHCRLLRGGLCARVRTHVCIHIYVPVNTLAHLCCALHAGHRLRPWICWKVFSH